MAVVNLWPLGKKEPEHAPIIRNLLVPNQRSARAGSFTGSITNSLALGHPAGRDRPSGACL